MRKDYKKIELSKLKEYIFIFSDPDHIHRLNNLFRHNNFIKTHFDKHGKFVTKTRTDHRSTSVRLGLYLYIYELYHKYLHIFNNYYQKFLYCW